MAQLLREDGELLKGGPSRGVRVMETHRMMVAVRDPFPFFHEMTESERIVHREVQRNEDPMMLMEIAER